MNLNLENKVAVITGGSRGIGRATALRFAEEGCKIAICARGQAGLDETLSALQKHGVEAFGQTADVSKPGETEKFIQAAADTLGGIDCLINNVGGTAGSRDFATSDDAAWQETFDLNLFHAVRATRAALPHLKTGDGGSVVTISSISGWKPANSGAQYVQPKPQKCSLQGPWLGNLHLTKFASTQCARDLYSSLAAVGSVLKKPIQNNTKPSAPGSSLPNA